MLLRGSTELFWIVLETTMVVLHALPFTDFPSSLLKKKHVGQFLPTPPRVLLVRADVQGSGPNQQTRPRGLREGVPGRLQGGCHRGRMLRREWGGGAFFNKPGFQHVWALNVKKPGLNELGP